MSLAFEIHGWRGFSVEADLFLKWMRLGFLSVGICRGSLIDRLLTMLERVK